LAGQTRLHVLVGLFWFLVGLFSRGLRTSQTRVLQDKWSTRPHPRSSCEHASQSSSSSFPVSLLTHTRSLLTHTRSLLTHTRSLLTHTRSLLTHTRSQSSSSFPVSHVSRVRTYTKTRIAPERICGGAPDDGDQACTLPIFAPHARIPCVKGTRENRMCSLWKGRDFVGHASAAYLP
jgi:hypothetical protein